jgi:hypothetical protein
MRNTGGQWLALLPADLFQPTEPFGAFFISGNPMTFCELRVRPLDHLQWVLERRKVRGGGRWGHLKQDTARSEAWLPLAFCRTRAGLETALSRLRQDDIVFDAGLLAGLPDHFDGSPAKPRRPFIEKRIVVPSGAEISQGITVALEAGIPLSAVSAAIEANRPRAARLLALIGLGDDTALKLLATEQAAAA